jgi:osmotically-inducible protein OsmY
MDMANRYDRDRYGRSYYEEEDRYERDINRDRGYDLDYDRDRYDRERNYGERQPEDRGFFERVGEEVSSWFGDEDDEERRRRAQESEYRRGSTRYGRGSYDEQDWRDRQERVRSISGEMGEPGWHGYGRREVGEYGRQGAGSSFVERQRGKEQGSYGRQERESLYGRRTGRYGEPSQQSRATMTYTEIWLVPGRFTGRGPKSYQRSDDRIREDVNERLTQHGQIDATDIEVEVNNGQVILKGAVGTRQEKRMAEDVADSVSGVKDVQNHIRLRERAESEQPQARTRTQTAAQQSQTAETTGQTGQRSRTTTTRST